MHSYISYNKLASLYICFCNASHNAHNETKIIHHNYHNQRAEDNLRIRNFTEETRAHSDEMLKIRFDTSEGESKIFDMIMPYPSEDILLWHKTANYVVSTYVYMYVIVHTCVRVLCVRTGR